MNVLNALKKVEKTGKINRKHGEMLIGEGLACFGGPRPEIHMNFNCIHLTDKGLDMLERNENYNISD